MTTADALGNPAQLEWHATLEARLKGTPGFLGVFMADALRGMQTPGNGSLIACAPRGVGLAPRYVAIVWVEGPAALLCDPRGVGLGTPRQLGDDDAMVAVSDFVAARQPPAKKVTDFPFGSEEQRAFAVEAAAAQKASQMRALPLFGEETQHDPWGNEDGGVTRWDDFQKADQYLSELSSLFCVQEVLRHARIIADETPLVSCVKFTHRYTGDWRICRRNAEVIQKEVGISTRLQPRPQH